MENVNHSFDVEILLTFGKSLFLIYFICAERYRLLDSGHFDWIECIIIGCYRKVNKSEKPAKGETLFFYYALCFVSSNQ